jgi:hypothetical protein
VTDDELVKQVKLKAEVERLRRALRAAVLVWCPRHPGGDGADGETYELCIEALKT